MNQTAPGVGQAPPPSPTTPAPSIWDRLLDDLHKNPRRYINGVLIAAVPVMLGILGYRLWSAQKQEAAGTLASTWVEIWDREPKERAAGLEELGSKVRTPEEQALRLYDLATTYKELGDVATTNAEKITHYEKAISTCSDLKSKYPNALWSVIPTRPPTSAGTKALSSADQILDYCQRQVDWLKQHPFTGGAEADPGLKVTFELEDGRKFVVGKLFSRAAPYHVQNFVELARRGYFEGTGFTRLAQGYKKGARPKQGDTPPPISIEGGHPMSKVTPDDREDDDAPKDVGYSVREEPNALPIVRGSLVAVPDSASGGDSPSRFKIYADEPYYPSDTVFGEVTEGLEIVDALVNAPASDLTPTRPRDLIRIKKAVVEGSVLAPPEGPFPPDLVLPAGPKPESRAESRPESQPESRNGSESQPK